MISGQDIICISSSDWNRPWGSRQQLMLRLSSANRILYVEYQASCLHFSLWYSRFKEPGGYRNKANKNLFIFTPYLSLPFRYYFRFINKINQRMLLWALKRIIKKLGFKDPILWIYTPSAADLLGAIGAKLILYHCIADFPDEKKNNLRKQTIFLMEKELVQKSNLVLALTNFLYEKFKTMNANTYLFPSAVDDKLFLSSLNGEACSPPDIANLRRPRVGLIGYLDGKVLDLDLLRYIADTRPGWELVLIGPYFRNTGNFKDLAKKKNIHFIGEKWHDEVPRYIAGLDICMIPYRLNEFTNNVSPLKLYEYMALGKPVVATNLSSLAGFKGFIRLSDTKENFVSQIELSLAEDSEELIRGRQNTAKENSWEKRLQFVSGLIHESNIHYST